VRLAIEARKGRVHTARTASTGLNSQLAVVLDTDAGGVFVKGLRADHPGAVRQGREAMINPHVRAVAPRLLWIIDWAWPTRGAAFIDAACFLIWAMAAGHSASQAEALAAQCPGWQHAPSAAIDVFALASTRLYNEIARNGPQPFKQRLAAVAHEWACHRLGARLP